MQSRLIKSPWIDVFADFASSVEKTAILVSPFISGSLLEQFTSYVKNASSISIEILTNLSTNNLLEGTVDIPGLAEFLRCVPDSRITHLPGLHAKVYVADDRKAIISSANLTVGGLYRNYEYGIEISTKDIVLQITSDLHGYASLGSLVSSIELTQLQDLLTDFRQKQSAFVDSATAELRKQVDAHIESITDALRNLRAKPGESSNVIFSRTILYLLQKGPLSTIELHPLIQSIHPDLCDDSIDRVINRVHFGKRWKHMVRNAQQSLQQRGLIQYQDGRWHLR